ncbi:hypothetical protein Acr_12g0005410 [Actinidia rufa]|uniref:FAS1 domain-containing protein n=1 Tax=Actinidia rufa TaxID=165716 RepID=A0A7J0FH36_9ERIC|nr:hypothetical protein Acr_12g0005410 [Actinidia rufa]
MDSQIYGLSYLLLLALLLRPSAAALPPHHRPSLPAQTNSNSVQINSNSVLVALLDSHYTELAELVEKALLLQQLEAAVNRHNITIFAPHNDALERALDPEFKRFLLEPRNLKSLQTLILTHIVPTRIDSPELTRSARESTRLKTLSNDHVNLLGLATVIRPNDVVRPDGVIHGIEQLLIPRSVQEDFNRRRSLRSIAAVLPEGAPEVDPRTHRLKAPAPAVPAERRRFYPFSTQWRQGRRWLLRRPRAPAVPTGTSMARPRSCVLPPDPGVPDGGEHVQCGAPVWEGEVRHAPAAAQGVSGGGGRGIDGVLFPAEEVKAVPVAKAGQVATSPRRGTEF